MIHVVFWVRGGSKVSIWSGMLVNIASVVDPDIQNVGGVVFSIVGVHVQSSSLAQQNIC